MIVGLSDARSGTPSVNFTADESCGDAQGYIRVASRDAGRASGLVPLGCQGLRGCMPSERCIGPHAASSIEFHSSCPHEAP